MKVGGVDPNGRARGLRQDINYNARVGFGKFNEKVLRDNVSISAGDFERIDIETNKPFVITVFKEDNEQEPWSLSGRRKVSGRLFSQIGLEYLLWSDGEALTYGNGSRAAAQTDIISTTSSRHEFLLYNRGGSASRFTVYLTELDYLNAKKRKSLTSFLEINEVNTLERGQSKTVLSTRNRVQLKSLEFIARANKGIRIVISPYNFRGDVISLGSFANGERAAFRVQHMPQTSLWDTLRFSENDVMFSLSKEWDYPHGLEISVVNESVDTPTVVGVRGYGYETAKGLFT